MERAHLKDLLRAAEDVIMVAREDLPSKGGCTKCGIITRCAFHRTLSRYESLKERKPNVRKVDV